MGEIGEILPIKWEKRNVREKCLGYRNRKLQISTAPTKAKSLEPSYSQALNQNKIDRQGSHNPESQTAIRLWLRVKMMFRVKTERDADGRG